MCSQMWKQRLRYTQCHTQLEFFVAEHVTLKKPCLCTEEQLSIGKSPQPALILHPTIPGD